MITKLKKKLIKFRNKYNRSTDIQEKQLVLQSRSLIQSNRSRANIQDLSDVEFSAYSQWGEDGIIDWLISQVPEIPRVFVEFGVENYYESNTRLLLKLQNWNGLVIDGSEENILDIKSQKIYWKHSLTAIKSFIDRENINKLIEDGGMKGEIGLLSIDIDGNDYWVWETVNIVKPAIVIIEYNAIYGDIHEFTVPYRADFQRTLAHYSNLYFGASLPALISLGKQKGYRFLGTNSAGNNAFFIHNDLAQNLTGKISFFNAYPSMFRESRSNNGNLTFHSGIERTNHISHQPLIDIKTGKVKRLEDYSEIFSEEWLQHRKRHWT